MSWPTVPAAELMLKRGGSVNPANYPEETFELLSIPAFDKGEPEIVEGKAIGSSKSCVQPNDVLLSKIVPHIKRCWVVPAPQGTYRQIGSGEWIIFRSDKIHPPFLRHFLTSEIFHKQFMNTTAGVGGSLVRARPAEVGNIEIPLPPLPEQKRIAAILDKADAIRRKRQQAIQLADDFLRAVFLDMFGDPVTNPKGLRVVPLISICEKVTDGTHQSPKWESSGVPFLFISNIVDGKINYDTNKFISDETFAELTRTTLIEKGDILYTTVGSYGNVAVVPGDRDFCFQRHIAHIKPSRQMVDPQFLAGMLSSSVVRQQADRLVRGVAQKTLNLRELKEIKVFDLPMKDQENYLRIIDPINKVAERQLFSGRELDKKFNALSQKAFLGQL